MTARPLESSDAIQEACRRLLRQAGVNNELPTPVEKIVATANLEFGSDDLFADVTLAQAPGELGRKIRALRGKVNALLDRKTQKVYLNPEIQLTGRRNFQTLHEVGHHWLDWQRDLYYPDDDYTLSWRTKIGQEREANFAGAELLFQGSYFSGLAREFRIGMAEVTELGKMIGASTHASLRRFVEGHHASVAGLVLDRSPLSLDPVCFKRREALVSASWRTRFVGANEWPRVLSVTEFPFVAEIGRLGFELPPIGFTFRLDDRGGRTHELNGELISNSYNLLVLLWDPQREWFKRRRTLESSRQQ